MFVPPKPTTTADDGDTDAQDNGNIHVDDGDDDDANNLSGGYNGLLVRFFKILCYLLILMACAIRRLRMSAAV